MDIGSQLMPCIASELPDDDVFLQQREFHFVVIIAGGKSAEL